MSTATEAPQDTNPGPAGQSMTDQPLTRGPWPHKAAQMAGTLSLYPEYRRGELAELRRMDPQNPGPPAYWRLMAHHQLLEYSEITERKWALILKGIALMTPNTSTKEHPRSAHNPTAPLGRALYLGNDERRSSAFYHENRLNRLLQATGTTLQASLINLFHTLSQQNIAVNWRQIARLILAEGYDQEASRRIRKNIAKDYYQAEYRSSRPLPEESPGQAA